MEYRREAGIFTVEELHAVFPAEGLGPWADIVDSTCFMLAAYVGGAEGRTPRSPVERD